MSKTPVKAEPLSRKKIREMTFRIGKMFGIENQMYFDVISFLEIIMPQMFDDYQYEIISTHDMIEEGLAIPDKKCIKIREDVYDRATEGSARDRFTIAHEIGHYLLHHSSRVGHARLKPGETIPAYCDPEWQANTFAGELLVPAHLIKGKHINDICKQCQVSSIVGKIQSGNI